MAWVKVAVPGGSEITVTPELLSTIVAAISCQFHKLTLPEIAAYSRALKMTPAQIINLVRGVQQCQKT